MDITQIHPFLNSQTQLCPWSSLAQDEPTQKPEDGSLKGKRFNRYSECQVQRKQKQQKLKQFAEKHKERINGRKTSYSSFSLSSCQSYHPQKISVINLIESGHWMKNKSKWDSAEVMRRKSIPTNKNNLKAQQSIKISHSLTQTDFSKERELIKTFYRSKPKSKKKDELSAKQKEKQQLKRNKNRFTSLKQIPIKASPQTRVALMNKTFVQIKLVNLKVSKVDRKWKQAKKRLWIKNENLARDNQRLEKILATL